MMERDGDMHYGAWLREARKARGLVLAQISEVIRIDVAYLRALESGNIAVLPEPYIRAFLKTYAGHLGLDPDEAVMRLNVFLQEQEERLRDVRAAVHEKEGKWYPDGSRMPEETPLAPMAVETGTGGRGRGSQFLITAVVVLFMAGATFLAIRLTGGSNEPAPASSTLPAVATDEDTVAVPPQVTAFQPEDTAPDTSARFPSTPSAEAPQRTLPAQPFGRGHLLVVDALEATWVEAVADGSTIVSRIVPAGGTVRIPFADTLVVRAGKNWSLRLDLDGRPITDLGPEGYVLSSLVLTGDGVLSRRLSLPPEPPPGGMPAVGRPARRP